MFVNQPSKYTITREGVKQLGVLDKKTTLFKETLSTCMPIE